MADSFGCLEVFGFDPNNPEDCKVTIGEVIEFMNAERAAIGLPAPASVIIIGTDEPYENFRGVAPDFEEG